MSTLFWISVLYLLFVYIGYGVVLVLINTFRRTAPMVPLNENELPHVAVLIAAYNEAYIITDKLKNTASLHYPKDKLHIYVVSDGSDDHTNELVQQFPEVTLFFKKPRKGKTAAINRVMPFIQQPICVFTDANVMLNPESLRELAKHYKQKSVGAVSGEKRVSSSMATAASTEGFYWQYESALKNQDAQLSSLIGAAGELFSIRTALFTPLPDDTILDDLMISMNILRKGFRIAYEPNAFATEAPSFNIDEEHKRKVRIGAGGLQSMMRLLDFLNPFRYGIISIQYFLRRFSRWIITPLLIPIAFVSNALLIHENYGYELLFGLQLVFHGTAGIGYIMQQKHIRLKLFFIPYYFDFMHYCMIAGWIKYLSGNQHAAWQKAKRSVTN